MSRSQIYESRSESTAISTGGMASSRSSRMEASSSSSYSARGIYRGLSPASQNRLESRIKELEDLLEMERDGRSRAERNMNDYANQLDAANERLDEAGGMSSQAQEMLRRRDQEVQKLKKDLENANSQLESLEQTVKKKYTVTITELTGELENANKQKSRAEKEKSNLLIEIDNLASQVDQAMKAKSRSLHEARAVCRLRNVDLQRVAHEYETQAATLSKAKSSLQSQVDDLKKSLDEETRSRNNLQAQLMTLQQDYYAVQSNRRQPAHQVSKLNADLASLKSKFDRELTVKLEEYEEISWKDISERERTRARKPGEDQAEAHAEIKELQGDIDALQAANQELASRAKQAESTVNQLTIRCDELSSENSSLSSTNQGLQADNAKLKKDLQSAEDKRAALERENTEQPAQGGQQRQPGPDPPPERLRGHALPVPGRARDSLASSLRDAEEALRELEQKYQQTTQALASLKTELEAKLNEKEAELESLRKSSQRTIEELHVTITEIESKYKGEISRTKKKYEALAADLEGQIDNLGRMNAGWLRTTRACRAACTSSRPTLRRSVGLTMLLNNLAACEKRRAAAQGELDEARGLKEAAERKAKAAEAEAAEATGRLGDLQAQMQSLSNDKRRLEAEAAAAQAEIDDAHNGRLAEADRANRLAGEAQRLADELRLEQENYKNAESLRKQLEVEIREITVKLEEAEAFATREGRRMVSKLQGRVRDLEAELDQEQRKAKDAQAASRKFERQAKEAVAQTEEERRMNMELQDLLDKTQLKLKTYKRQIEESEEISAIAMTKYRKAQQQIEEAEHRADLAERTMSSRRGSSTVIRSVSVAREMSSSRRVGARATSIM
uniref:Paramyosin n=1 Tax=Macrostomum lignano TaxID=282301 RepID=A0A1I8HGM6_9PLAT